MDWGFRYSIFVYAILFFQLVSQGSGSRKILEMNTHKHSDSASHMGDDRMDPEVNIFFTPDDLKTGKTLQIFFAAVGDASASSPRLLSRADADSIPFSSAELPHLLDLFSFSPASPQARAMEETLGHCEFPAMKGETKFCATSLESLLDSVRGILGSGSRIRVVTTEFVTNRSAAAAAVRNYTIVGAPREIPARKMVGCHSLPYPYAVFYCHSQEGDTTRVFKASLVSENGEERAEAVAVCHMDTSRWNRDHVSFRVLGIRPGSSPVCHFFPPDNLVWVSSDSHDF
ncbi:PREDICTED: BURP domain protein USPL1-like [Ipomoea nil]|uniref:BURP domain protein USPL1-like n=1 Tax=Ipomoea nil TaxID=35883 RepID=UPI0009012505|nr:PREDICTED: BURP domain protein USPL1-like [Ipomoea nil]